MVCPVCSKSFEQRLNCPTCGVRLHYRTRRNSGGGLGAFTGQWLHKSWARVLAGLLLAQGLAYGFTRLYTSVVLATEGPEALKEAWGSLGGLILLQSLQLLALLIGSLLAGSCQRHGLLLGALVGVWSGMCTVLLQATVLQAFSSVALYGQPLLQATVGGLGGWVGSLIWKPIQPVGLPGPRLVRKAPARRTPLFAGPVIWTRVTVGAIVVVIGHASAGFILNMVLDASGGKLSTSYHMQDILITWEIKALTMLFGGGVAGAMTSNGMKQGLFVGLIASMILLIPPLHRETLWLAFLTFVSTFSLGLAGGWFGSQLLPPVVTYKSTRGIGNM
jgi:hypothetical protein